MAFQKDQFDALLEPDKRGYSERNGIPRFTPDFSYSTGNFSKLREKHAELQLDSRNGTSDRMHTLLTRTQWPAEFFKGKLVLECGCGAGPDTEVLLKLGAKVVAVDIAGVDIAAKNIGENPDVQFVQGSIMDLPFKKGAFDIVFCHRVLQHTPDPVRTLDHILQFVKPDGAVFVHSYARNFRQMFRWKYALLPLTRRMDPEKLYNTIRGYAPFAYRVTGAIRRIPGGKYFNHVFIPFLNHRNVEVMKSLSDEQIMEHGIHNTFDALSPHYDEPVSAATMKQLAERHLQRPFEVTPPEMITLLRTIVK
jgi:SAM-dependent methyltransferase